jgi:recombination protein RecT
VVLLRPGPDGLEVLLTQRPATMAFAPDVHVFPGGAIDPGDGDAVTAAIREVFEEAGILLADPLPTPEVLETARRALLAGELTLPGLAAQLGMRLRTDALVPLSRWVTPAPYPRRFDATFFAAELPAGTTPAFDPREIAGHRWLTPRAALESMAAGSLELWLPTSTTLQQLEHVRSLADIRAHIQPGRSLAPRIDRLTDEIVRVEVGSAGSVPGQTSNTWLVGRDAIVVVDPGDPGEEAMAAILQAAGEGRIRAIALTHPDPDHAAGAESLAERLDVPVFVGPRGGRHLPFAVRELPDHAAVPAGDVPLRVHQAAGPRPEHLVLELEERRVMVTGDLVGDRASRAVLGPPDKVAWQASLGRMAALRPGRLLPGHGPAIDDPERVIAAGARAITGTRPA